MKMKASMEDCLADLKHRNLFVPCSCNAHNEVEHLTTCRQIAETVLMGLQMNASVNDVCIHDRNLICLLAGSFVLAVAFQKDESHTELDKALNHIKWCIENMDEISAGIVKMLKHVVHTTEGLVEQ